MAPLVELIRRRVRARRWCLLAAVLCAGCSRIEEQQVTPWFKVRRSTSPQIGGFADSVTRTTYHVRRSGGWRQIDDEGVGGATPINDTTVAYYHNGQARMIHEGDAEGVLTCGSVLHGATFLPGAGFVDCVTAVEGPASAVATTVRFRRIDAAGRVIHDRTIAEERPGRVFLQPRVTFYDETGKAYLVTMNEDFRVAPECTIVGIGDGALELRSGSPSMQARDCSESKSWSPIVGRRIRKPGE
jgi:hypothetical protein